MHLFLTYLLSAASGMVISPATRGFNTANRHCTARRANICASSSNQPAALTINVPTLTLLAADKLANAALAEAERMQFNPISVYVVDVAGRVVVSKTMDGCPTLIPDLALAKARTCVSVGLSSRAVKDKYDPERQTQVLSMGTVSQGNWAPFPGGVLCLAPPPTPEDIFEAADADKSGTVSLEELNLILSRSQLDSVQVKQLIDALPLSDEQEATKDEWLRAWETATPKIAELKKGIDGALGFDIRTVLGAIGVSGAAADEDEHCALAAAHAIGFVTEPEESLIAPTRQA